MRIIFNIIVILLSITIAPVLSAEWVSLDPSASISTGLSVEVSRTELSGTDFIIQVPGFETSIREQNGQTFTQLQIPGAGVLADPGKPFLPVLRERIAVPQDGAVSLAVEILEETVLTDYNVWPAQPQYDRDDVIRPSFQLDAVLYHTDAFYPEQSGRIVGESWVRDLRTVMVEIAPVRYNPTTGDLRIATKLQVRVLTEGTRFYSSPVFPSFYTIYQKNILNAHRLGLKQRTDAEPMLIIANDSFIGALDSFVEWKTKRGLAVTVAPTSQTGTTYAAIRSYIENAYTSWNPAPVYILLVGDYQQIQPMETSPYGTASDYLFTTLEGSDLAPDLFISRLSAQNLNELGPQLDKIMHYETIPVDSAWLDHVVGISSSLSGPMGINDDDRIDEIASRWMDHNPGCDVDYLYESNGQGTTQNIASSINAGAFWAAYCGHGSGTSWSGPSFTNSDVNALTNGYLTPFIMDVSCLNGGFGGSSDCFAERWMKGGTVGNPHGTVGMYSSYTSTAWDPPAIMAWGVCYAVTGDSQGTISGGHIKMGQMTYDGMMYLESELGPGADTEEVLHQYILFGDCSAFMRSNALIHPVVTHLPTAPLAPYPFEVMVADARGPIENAVVCAYKPGEIHEVVMTDQTGSAILNIEPLTIGDMILTVSGQNLMPYESTVMIAPAGCGIVLLDRITYNCDDDVVIRVFDADINGDPGIVETTVADISSTSEPLPETILLTETGPDTAEFRGTIQTSPTESGTGFLRLAHNDAITVHYHDDDCDGTPDDVTDSANADCMGPILTNIMVTNVGIDTATISWMTDELSDTVVTFGESIPPEFEVRDDQGDTYHEMILTELDPCTDYYFMVSSSDPGQNETTDNNGGQYYRFTTLQLMVMLNVTMDTNPAWTYDGQWAWGTPTGQGGDPTGGYTGSNVVGYNLNGQYPDNMTPAYATTQSFDCSSAGQAYLSFWKWLGVESSSYDHATVEISNNNGATWNIIWQHDGGSTDPDQWTFVEYDISEWAAGHSQVKLRWGMGPSDGSVTYCGWNIDDVMVSYTSPCNVPILNYESHAIDDSSGNNDGEINAGETIAMSVTLENLGLNATNISTTLTTTNSHITLLQAESDYPDIPQSGSGTSITEFVFQVSPEAYDGEVIPFVISWMSDENSGTASFSEMIVAPTLEFSNATLIDLGDGDGIFDPGETDRMEITLANNGNGLAMNITAQLTSDHPEYITIVDGTASFPNIPGGSLGTSIAPHFTVTASPETPNHTLITFSLSITAMGYSAEDQFTVDVTSSTFALRFGWNMDTNPNWTTQGQWQWGVPLGQNGDPSSGYTGSNVYGYNLSGSYPNNLAETYLTTTPLDCSNLFNVEVHFMRWLGVESSTWDHASFRVSNNGVNWTTIWEHSGSTFTDTSWQTMTYDISSVADGQSTVYLRWVMGSTDSSVTYCGWNIDDVEVWAESNQVVPTPTPTPPPDCIHDGDVNMNGAITAGDAQLAFSITLGAYTPTYTERCAADCNGNGAVTAGDAQGIFALTLGLGSCSDPISREASSQPVVETLMSALQSRSVSDPSAANLIWLEYSQSSADTVVAHLMVANGSVPIDAFTIQLVYDSQNFSFQNGESSQTDPGWVEFGCIENETGAITIAAYAVPGESIPLGSKGSIGTLAFAVNSPGSAIQDMISIRNLSDDVEGFLDSTDFAR